jgi:hypothetical protein
MRRVSFFASKSVITLLAAVSLSFARSLSAAILSKFLIISSFLAITYGRQLSAGLIELFFQGGQPGNEITATR